MPPKSSSGKHTIVLVQQHKSLESRTYTDHESVTHAVQSLQQTYELALKQRKGTGFTYDTNDLFNFLDGLYDISFLVYEDNLKAYVPYDRQWIKQKLYATIKKQEGK